MEIIYLISGLLLLCIAGFDFFYSTLSGSGASFITKYVAIFAHKFQRALSRIFGRRVLSGSGMVVNLAVLLVWVLLFWLGLFLVYSSNPEAITNSNSRPANWVERLYFTGYVLSTLGIGNFKPVSAFFELVTSVFSFFGFVFFTTAMTYLISVASAVTHKRTLALAIRDLGETPSEVVRAFRESNTSYSYTQFEALKQMIERHVISHQAYPVVHFYDNLEEASALSINLAVLDEAVSILLASNDETLHPEIRFLRNALDQFVQHIEKKYNYLSMSDHLPEVDQSQLDLPAAMMPLADLSDLGITERRKIFGGLLKSEGFTWKEVYGH